MRKSMPSDLVLKELFQGLSDQCWRSYLERPAFEETAIGTKDMAMGVEIEEITEGLNGYDCAGYCILVREDHPQERLQRFPHAVTQFAQESTIPGSGPGQAPRK